MAERMRLIHSRIHYVGLGRWKRQRTVQHTTASVSESWYASRELALESSHLSGASMSRHRDVRNLDYDELLDDEAGNGEMTPQELERLDAAVEAITQRLGDGFSLKEIKDTAWYYYFDVDQSTNYLLGMASEAEASFLILC